MNSDEVFRLENAVLVLTSSVDDFCIIVLSFEPYDLRKGVLNRRVISLNKMTFYKLYSQWRFAYHIQQPHIHKLANNAPTDLLPTRAIFRCLAVGIAIYVWTWFGYCSVCSHLEQWGTAALNQWTSGVQSWISGLVSKRDHNNRQILGTINWDTWT